MCGGTSWCGLCRWSSASGRRPSSAVSRTTGSVPTASGPHPPLRLSRGRLSICHFSLICPTEAHRRCHMMVMRVHDMSRPNGGIVSRIWMAGAIGCCRSLLRIMEVQFLGKCDPGGPAGIVAMVAGSPPLRRILESSDFRLAELLRRSRVHDVFISTQRAVQCPTGRCCLGCNASIIRDACGTQSTTAIRFESGHRMHRQTQCVCTATFTIIVQFRGHAMMYFRNFIALFRELLELRIRAKEHVSVRRLDHSSNSLIQFKCGRPWLKTRYGHASLAVRHLRPN